MAARFTVTQACVAVGTSIAGWAAIAAITWRALSHGIEHIVSWEQP